MELSQSDVQWALRLRSLPENVLLLLLLLTQFRSTVLISTIFLKRVEWTSSELKGSSYISTVYVTASYGVAWCGSQRLELEGYVFSWLWLKSW